METGRDRLLMRFAFARLGGKVKRFHTITTIQQQTVAQHSWGVALIMHELLGYNPPTNMWMYALLHDVAECKTGDVPAPTKLELDVKECFDELEEKWLKEAGYTTLEIDKAQKLVVKIADILEGMAFCMEERKLGNRTEQIQRAFSNYEDYLFNTLEVLSGVIMKMNKELSYSGNPYQHVAQNAMDIYNYTLELWGK